MSDIIKVIQARRDMIKKLNVMARKIEQITAFVLTGENGCPPDNIRLVAAAADADDIDKIYADINFLVGEFLTPQTCRKEETEGRIIVKYSFDNGMNIEIFICQESNLPPFDWWMPCIDKHGAAENFYPAQTKMFQDPAGDIQDESVDECDAQIPEQPAQPEQIIEPVIDDGGEADTEKNSSPRWEDIYNRINLAKHAIAGGSVIYACEIINELRTLLIRLICQKSGITENYAHSIDLLSNDYQRELIKTYPAKPEGGAMIAALAAELALFEKLMR